MSSSTTTRNVRHSTPSTHPPAPAHRVVPSRFGGVEVVRWPEEADRREELARLGQPCVFVLAVDEPAPMTELLEDWVREPIDTAELGARCAALLRRADCGTVPTLDDGLLLYRGAWAAIPAAQLAMVGLLLERLGRVVTKEELVAAAAASGGSDHADAVKAAMNRLVRRIAPLDLELRSIRGRGYLLQIPDRCPLHGSVSAAKTKDSSP